MINKSKESIHETYIVGKSSFRYQNLMKVKTKQEENTCYRIVFFSVIETADSVKEYRLTYILPK